MYKKEEILDKLKSLKPVFAKDGVLLLGIFGSFARGEEKEGSDIDLLIETTPRFLQRHKGFGYFAKLNKIREQLQKEFGTTVDLVDKEGLIQHNNDHILKSALYV